MNHITIELCAEDRARLDRLAEALEATQFKRTITMRDGAVDVIQEPATPQVAETHSTAEESPAVAPVIEEPTPGPVEEPKPVEVKPVSLAEFQKAVAMTCAKGAAQKAAARELITKYAASVTAVPEDKRAEIMDAMAML